MTQYRLRRKNYGKFEYSEWHRTLDATLYMTDLDSIEFRATKRGLRPVAIIETTLFPGDKEHTPASAYLSEIFRRYNGEKNFKGIALRHVSRKLNVNAYIVLHTLDMQKFWICNFTAGLNEWWMLNEKSYKEFLQFLPVNILLMSSLAASKI